MTFSKLVSPSILKLTPYLPGMAAAALEKQLGLKNIQKMASNENPIGPSTKAIAAAQATCTRANIYPESKGDKLCAMLAERLSIDANQLFIGNGSDEILHLLGELFLQPQTDLLISEYSFVSYRIIGYKNNANIITIPSKNWGHDLIELANAITENTRMIYLANPNNPTGTWFTEKELVSLLEKTAKKTIVVLDEAYYEYMGEHADYPNSIKLQERYPNLVITRTFSKAYGLARLRMGYCIADPEIIELLHRIRLPFNVNQVAINAACATLEDEKHLAQAIAVNQQGREYYTKQLKQLTIENIATAGNFITINIKQDCEVIFKKLLQQGIIVRPLTYYQMPQWIRVTISLPEENQRFLDALTDIL